MTADPYAWLDDVPDVGHWYGVPADPNNGGAWFTREKPGGPCLVHGLSATCHHLTATREDPTREATS